ncbi:DUF4185 domain-containing protein [Mycolicibacterium vaccae]|uniref:DUF4185 domain-containing protein n=1 Tax=Mycolicibacterium vaccae TaxID=1810 RepID=UPI003CE71B07
MSAAAYVGRVGGLAVALGVGSAVFTGHGVAWADDSESGGSTSSSGSASSASDSSGTTSRTRRNHQSAGERQSKRDTETDTDSGLVVEEPEAPVEEPEPPVVEEPDTVEDKAVSTPRRDRRTAAGEAEPTRPAATEKPAKSRSTTPAPDDTPATTTDDPSVAPKEPTKVAVFASATALAEAAATQGSPASVELDDATAPSAARKPNLVTAVVNVVHSMLDWANQRAGSDPASSPQPPFLWALVSFARRELENLFGPRGTVTAPDRAARATSLALAHSATAATAAAAANPRGPNWPSMQVSPSTNFVSWVTGDYVYYTNAIPQVTRKVANTQSRFAVWGTDVGVMWDNGIPDDPSTPDINENQVLIAVGDTFADRLKTTAGWRYNTLFRSSDRDLSDGMDIPNGEWYNGNMFGGAPLMERYKARPIINRPSWLPNSVTLIPTAGISVKTDVTDETPYGAVQYVSFMSVSNWGNAGRWTTNYSAIAYSVDNGENFVVAPQSVRYNSIFSGNRNFQQAAFVHGDDGYIYAYGTPNGRQGAAYLSRVTPENILDVSKYEYYKKGSSGWLGSTPARWVKGNPSSASAIIGKNGGACGATKPGYRVSEMSVQYNQHLGKYVVMYGDQFNNIVMRTSDTPQGGWSDAKVVMGQQNGGIYAPMMHPWSPSTLGTGSDLYWNLSLWSDYNIMLMRTDLEKL